MSDSEKSSEYQSDRERRAEKKAWKENRRWDQDYFENRIFGAFYLIIIGVIFLLNTTGVLPWSVWINILKFWPLFIVSAGIGLIFGGNRILKLIGSLIGLGIFLVILALAIFNPFVNGWSLIPLTSNSQTTNYSYEIKDSEYTNIKARNFNINLPLGEVNITDDSFSNFLTLDAKYYSQSERPEIVKSVDENTLNTEVKNVQNNTFNLNGNGPQYNFVIGRLLLPTSFNLKLGAGNTNVNLDKLKVKQFNAEVGAGNLEVTFTNASTPSDGISLKSGLGNIKITLSKEIGVKLVYKVGLGNLTLNNSKLTSGSGNGTVTTTNYEDSIIKVTLNIDSGLGNVDVITK